MAVLDREQLRKWAVSGAERRLVEIATEAAAIYKAFPELRDRRSGGAAETAAPARAAAKTPRRRTLSAAGRKRISDAQKKRWAAKKKGATG